MKAATRMSSRVTGGTLVAAAALAEAAVALQRVGGALCLAEAVDGQWATEHRRKSEMGHGGGGGGGGGGVSCGRRRRGGWWGELTCAKTPHELGALLLAFEDKVLAERLSRSFVATRRVAWLRQVSASTDAATLGALATELQGALVMPPFARTLRKLVRQLLKAKRSTLFAEPVILAFLIGDTRPNARGFDAVLAAPTTSATSGGSRRDAEITAKAEAAERWAALKARAVDKALASALTPTPSGSAANEYHISFDSHAREAGRKLSNYVKETRAKPPSERPASVPGACVLS
jgi:hypothetical protein